jgi:hypothetical protein
MMIVCLLAQCPNRAIGYELGAPLGIRNLGKLLREKRHASNSDTHCATAGNPIDGTDHSRGHPNKKTDSHTSVYLDFFVF